MTSDASPITDRVRASLVDDFAVARPRRRRARLTDAFIETIDAVRGAAMPSPHATACRVEKWKRIRAFSDQ